MKNSIIRLITAAALLAANFSFAADITIKTPDIKGAAKTTADGVKSNAKSTAGAAKGAAKDAASDAKAAVKSKLVDINTATEAELKAIPGLGDSYAAKIIAGRPYANKSQLKSRNIVPSPLYEKVKDLLVAKTIKK